MDSDVKSRLNVDLIVGPNSSYDEVIAISEKYLNENLKTLFSKEPLLQTMTYDDPTEGTINLNLDAPIVILDVGSEEKKLTETVIWMLCIKTGYIEVPGFDRMTLDNWRLAFEVDLTTDAPESTKDADGKNVATIAGRIYKYAGDCSIQRLFAELATAQTSAPSVDYTAVYDNESGGKKTTVADWIAAGNARDLAWTKFQVVFLEWASQATKNHHTTFNVNFHLDQSQVNAADPTYVPYYVHQQTYPYINKEKGIAGNTTTFTGQGLNAWLWCQMVGNTPTRLPKPATFPLSGNFITAPSSNNANDDIHGTFALSYNHFFETYLLPRLQVFNQACEVVGMGQTYSFGNDGYTTQWTYLVGNFQKPSTDDHFKFSRVTPTTDDALASYVFDVKNDASESHNWTDGDHHTSNIQHNSHAVVTVKWSLGGNQILVNGSTEYQFHQTDTGDRPAELKNVYLATWNFSLNITGVEGGIIQFTTSMTDGADGHASLVVKETESIQNGGFTTPAGQEDRIKQSFKDNISTAVQNLADDLKKLLSSTASYIYPSNGVLTFKNPVINRLGNLLVEIEYSPLVLSSNFVEVRLPDPIEKASAPDLTGKDKPATSSSSVAQKLPKLSWTMSPATAKADAKGANYAVVGKNNTTVPVTLAYARIYFTSASSGPNLFKEDQIMKTKSPFFAAPTPAVPAPADTNGVNPLDGSSNPAAPQPGAPPAAPATGKTVTVAASSPNTSLGAALVVLLAPTKSGATEWQAIINHTTTSKYFTVNPGDSVSCTFENFSIGTAGTYYLVTEESWYDTSSSTTVLSEKGSITFTTSAF